jgi:hypothetical protein
MDSYALVAEDNESALQAQDVSHLESSMVVFDVWATHCK